MLVLRISHHAMDYQRPSVTNNLCCQTMAGHKHHVTHAPHLSRRLCLLHPFNITPVKKQQQPISFRMQNGPSISLWLTLFGVVAGFLSTFWSFGYTRLSRRLYRYLSTGPDDNSKRVKKADVLNTLMRGSWINVLGLGSTLLGLQATVGLLVAKTLTNATANPFLAGGAGSYNPVLALDVFLVQVRTMQLVMQVHGAD